MTSCITFLKCAICCSSIGNLHENARAIAHQRIGADGTAVRQVLENEKTVLDDLVRLLTLHMRDEADTAGIVLVARIVKPLLARKTGGEFTRIGHRAHICCCDLVDVCRWRVLRHRLPPVRARHLRAALRRTPSLILGSARDSAVALSKIRSPAAGFPGEKRGFPDKPTVALRACHAFRATDMIRAR
jgi:hypothetical protein